MRLTCHNRCRMEQEICKDDNGPWTEAVLLNSEYEEIGYARSDDSFFGVWEIVGTDCNIYRAEIIPKA